jgi:arylsulfatase A-like enzyme
MLAALLSACSGSPLVDAPAVPHPSIRSTPDETAARPSPLADALVLGTTPRNLLVISLDTTRRDRIGLFSGLDTTPNFDAIFGEGVVLADHRSCANWTAPSSYCAESGNSHLDADTWLSGGNEGSRDRRVDWPDMEAPTLASILRDQGFSTTLITSNSYFSSLYNGNGYGFDKEIRRLWQPADVIADTAINEADDLGADGNPWYMHVHFIDPHASYVAPHDYWTDPRLECPWAVDRAAMQYRIGGGLWSRLDDEERALARQCLANIYEGELRYWDEKLGAMWADFEDRGLLEDTLVVFWTDHGESWGEHDDLFFHGVSLYDTENRSTAAFWASTLRPGWWSGPTIHQDLAPTILNALDVPLGDHSGVVLGHARRDRVRVVFNYLRGYNVPLIAAIQGDKKLMYWWNGTKRFYDLATDPNEETDLYDAADTDVIAMWDELQPVIERTDAAWPGLSPQSVGP